VRERLATRVVFATVEGPEVDVFRERFAELAAEARSSALSSDDPRVYALEAVYDAVPRRQRLHAWNVKYPPEWLADLADDLVFLDFVEELTNPDVAPSS
jgi:hypothetical protein